MNQTIRCYSFEATLIGEGQEQKDVWPLLLELVAVLLVNKMVRLQVAHRDSTTFN